MYIRRTVLFGAVPVLGMVVYTYQAHEQYSACRWNHPGPAHVIPLGNLPEFGPGEASYSYMPAGIHLEAGAPDDRHGKDPVTRARSELLPGDADGGKAKRLFRRAVEIWKNAINEHGLGFSCFEVNDECGKIGGPHMDSNVGDIRVGVLPFVDPPEEGIDYLAHAEYPDTALAGLEHDKFGSLGGDIHFRPHKEFHPTGVYWVSPDDLPDGSRQYDLLTVMIHEVGHALGLKHVPQAIDPESVMNAKYNGPKRKLSDKDIKSIQDLYHKPKR